MNMYQQIIEHSYEPIVVHANHKVLFINEPGAKFLRGNKQDIVGANIVDIFEDKQLIIERIEKGMTTQEPAELIEQTISRLDGTSVEIELYCHPFLYGDQIAIQTSFRDITKRKETETQLRNALNEIRQLIAPLVPLQDGVAVLPLIGSMDENRAQQLLEDIPGKVKNSEINSLIIDFSGIYNVCDIVTDTLFKITHVLKLLGVRSFVTGIKPEHAQSAALRGIQLASMKSFSTVKHALKYL